MSYSPLTKQDRIYVAGHNGLVGQALLRVLKAKGYKKIVLASRSELDLCDPFATRRFLTREKPDVIFLAAAKVGGIKANNEKRVEFLTDNLAISTNIMQAAHLNDVRLVVNFGSSCIYPRECAQPIKEEFLLTSGLEYTNRPYALAKIAALELVNAMNIQHGRRWFSVMPTNLFGPGDKFDLENSHVLPALMRRFHEAKLAGAPESFLWGSGRPKREFLYADDCADAVIFLAERLGDSFFSSVLSSPLKSFHINVGGGTELTILECAQAVAAAVGYGGHLTFDPAQPDGTPRKLLDNSILHSLGWRPRHSFNTALKETYGWFAAREGRHDGAA